MNRTSRSSSEVRIAARSPARSMAGPEAYLTLTPSSRAMIVASVVLPRPGGPYRRTWSAASSLPRAACQQDGQVGLDLALADVLGERARPQGALDDEVAIVLEVRREDAREIVGHRSRV